MVKLKLDLLKITLILKKTSKRKGNLLIIWIWKNKVRIIKQGLFIFIELLNKILLNSEIIGAWLKFLIKCD